MRVILNVAKNVKTMDFSYTRAGNAKCYTHSGKLVWQFLTKLNIWDFRVVQWLRLCAPNAGFDPWSGNQIPHTATRSLNGETKRSCIPHAATKTLHSHINILKRNTPNISLPYHPTTALLSIYAREMKINIHTKNCTPKFISLFVAQTENNQNILQQFNG